MERTLQEKTGLQASLSTIGLIKTSVSAVGLNVRRRASNVMLTPERIFVVQINDKVKAYRPVSFTDQINVELWDICSNFQSSIQEEQKYLLNCDVDGITDCIIQVNSQP